MNVGSTMAWEQRKAAISKAMNMGFYKNARSFLTGE
jgi:hypothetical protein